MKQILVALGIVVMFVGCGDGKKASEETNNATASTVDSLANTPQGEIDRLTRYIEANPSNWALYKDRAVVYYDQGRVDWAIHDIREAIKMKDDDPELHYLRAYFALAEGDSTLARSEFQLASQYGSANPDVYYQQGQMRFLRKEYDQAMESYLEAIRLDSLDPIYPFAIGFLEQEKGAIRSALTRYNQALSLNPQHEKTLLQLHDLYVSELNNPDKADEYNTTLLNAKPRHSLANYNKGSYYYRKAIPLKAKQLDAYQQAINKAVEHYTLSISYSDSFALPYVYRGMSYVEGERYDLAFEDFKKAVEIDDSQYLAHFQLAGLYDFYKEEEKAVFHAQKAKAGGYE